MMEVNVAIGLENKSDQNLTQADEFLEILQLFKNDLTDSEFSIAHSSILSIKALQSKGSELKLTLGSNHSAFDILTLFFDFTFKKIVRSGDQKIVIDFFRSFSKLNA